jgi:hypothetical protein
MKKVINRLFGINREPKPGPVHTCDEKHAHDFDWMNNLAIRCDESGKIKPMEEKLKLSAEDK